MHFWPSIWSTEEGPLLSMITDNSVQCSAHIHAILTHASQAHDCCILQKGQAGILQTQLQASFLEDMVTFCTEGDSLESTWAADEEVATTEELEARLRSHRLPNPSPAPVMYH